MSKPFTVYVRDNEYNMHKIVEVDSYEPDYKAECINCGQSPVVTAVSDGVEVMRTDLCGPCTFGEAKCIDPEEW